MWKKCEKDISSNICTNALALLSMSPPEMYLHLVPFHSEFSGFEIQHVVYPPDKNHQYVWKSSFPFDERRLLPPCTTRRW